jgi:hypothetical protein
MALSASTLKTALKTALIDEAGAQDNTATDKLAEVIANAVVDHITANAVVTVASGIPVATTGTAAAQTGATTSTGTGTIA